MAEHTPGPWRQDVPGSLLVVGGEGNPEHIVAGCWVHSDERFAEGVANARLIAAAPEMLAALKAIDAAADHNGLDAACDCVGVCETALAAWNEADRLLRAAIAKAEGRTDGNR